MKLTKRDNEQATGSKTGSNGMPNLLQQRGINARKEKGIGRRFLPLCMSLAYYIGCKILGEKYTAIPNFTAIPNIDKDLKEALTELQNDVAKVALNEYSINNGMQIKETKAGNEYPEMTWKLADRLFSVLGQNYTIGKTSVDLKPNGKKLPKDLVELLVPKIEALDYEIDGSNL